MGDYEMADYMADPAMSRRDYGTGSVHQAHTKTCPRPTGRACKCPWRGTLEAGYTPSGGRRRVTVVAATKTAAQRKLRDKRVELDREGVAAKRTVTVAKWAEEWLGEIRTKVRPAAYETDRAAMRWVVGTIGHVRLAELTPGHVRAVRRAITTTGGKSTSTALRYHGSLVRMLKAAVLEGYRVPPNVLLAKAPAKAIHDRQALPMDETLRVIAHLTRRDPDGRLVMPDSSRWTLAFLQGIRQAEALGLTWEEVGEDTITIQWQAKSLRYVDRSDPSRGFAVPDGYEAQRLAGAAHLVRPKSAAGRRVLPLVSWSRAALDDWRPLAPTRTGLVWPGRITSAGAWPRNPATDRAEWERIQAAVGIEHPSGRPYLVHEIRNTTATLLMELGVPESVRKAIMGHASIVTTHGYETVERDLARRALDQAAEALGLRLPPPGGVAGSRALLDAGVPDGS